MTKKYEPVPNEARRQLIELIHNKGYSISKAALLTNIYYPTAKAINKVYVKENRTQKKAFRCRVKNCDKNLVVIRKKILVEKPSISTDSTMNDESRICGIKFLDPNSMKKLKREEETVAQEESTKSNLFSLHDSPSLTIMDPKNSE